jgi:ABC-type xylose transport system substrate-binding protein
MKRTSAMAVATLAAAALTLTACGRDDAGSTASETGKDVPSALAVPVWITADKVQSVIDDGFQKAADICVDDFVKACEENGVK